MSFTKRSDQCSQTRPRIFSHAMTNTAKSTRKNKAKPTTKREQSQESWCLSRLYWSLTGIAFKQISTYRKRWSTIFFTQGKSKVDDKSKQTHKFHPIRDRTLSKIKLGEIGRVLFIPYSPWISRTHAKVAHESSIPQDQWDGSHLVISRNPHYSSPPVRRLRLQLVV